ncbi:hypothetical protein HDU98_010654 [Podochytrium sp. JEL0797]|nr:hypothetical protein HDU98_010654 [Podochytrium sp. JEL0797]
MWKTLTSRKSTLTIRNSEDSETESLCSSPGSETSFAASAYSSSATLSSLSSPAPPPPPPRALATPQPTLPRNEGRVVSLVEIASTTSQGATRHVALGVSLEARAVLAALPAPLSVAVFAGFGRSGKSRSASRLAAFLEHWDATTPKDALLFASKPGNTPCTHGIDLAVVKHPDPNKGHILLLDCEGASNHNQTAIPFVMGLAARLASKIFVFERGCFTTAGLESVMHIVNMGLATLPIQDDEPSTTTSTTDMTRSLVLVENMSINSGIPSTHLLNDLLSSTDGDEMSNRVKRLIRDQFDVSFEKLPFVPPTGSTAEFDDVCRSMVGDMVDGMKLFEVGGVPADGKLLIQLCDELLTQIRHGGSRFNMISATESLVSNMATEAANTVWSEFLHRATQSNNTPAQLNGRKHLRTVLRELEGFQNMALIDLEGFTSRLQPQQPAAIAKIIWERNYDTFIEEVKAAHGGHSGELVKHGVWAVRLNRFVVEMVEQFVEALRQMVRLARFGSMLVVLTNYYFWKHGLGLIRNAVGGVISEIVD